MDFCKLTPESIHFKMPLLLQTLLNYLFLFFLEGNASFGYEVKSAQIMRYKFALIAFLSSMNLRISMLVTTIYILYLELNNITIP